MLALKTGGPMAFSAIATLLCTHKWHTCDQEQRTVPSGDNNHEYVHGVRKHAEGRRGKGGRR